ASAVEVAGLDALGDVTLRFHVSSVQYAQPAGGMLLLPPAVFNPRQRSLFDDKPRTLPIEYRCTATIEDTVEITLPPGLRIDEAPPALDVALPFARFRSTLDAQPAVVRYTRRYERDRLV